MAIHSVCIVKNAYALKLCMHIRVYCVLNFCVAAKIQSIAFYVRSSESCALFYYLKQCANIIKGVINMKSDLSKTFVKKEMLLLAIRISDTIITGLACFGLFIGGFRFFIGKLKGYDISNEYIINTESLILASFLMLIISTIVYRIHKSDADNIDKNNE